MILRALHQELLASLTKFPAVAQLGVKNFDGLHAHPLVGHSWEGFAVEHVLRMKPRTWQSYFFRTFAGAEIDLLLIDEALQGA